MNNHLYRSRDDRMLAGVAGGLAEHWGADPSLVRLVWALLVIFTGGIALAVYIVMAIVVPEGDGELPQPVWPPTAQPSAAGAPVGPTPATETPGPAPAATATYSEPTRREARVAARAARREARRRGVSAAPAVIGVFLVMLGGFFLLREWLPQLDFDWFWPLMLIAVGVLLLVLAIGRRPTDPGATP